MNGLMNRVYRVVWNAATSAWQAVAENAKGQGKTKTTSGSATCTAAHPIGLRRTTMSIAVLAALAAPTGQALADTSVCDNGTSLSNGLAADESCLITSAPNTQIVVGNTNGVAMDARSTLYNKNENENNTNIQGIVLNGDMLRSSNVQNSSTISHVANDGGEISGISAHNLFGSAVIDSFADIGLNHESNQAAGIKVQSLNNTSEIRHSSGTISVVAADNAYGIVAEDLFHHAKIVNNNGSITVGSDDKNAYGIYANTLNNDTKITNSGDINAFDGNNNNGIFGINANYMHSNAAITNQGSITATGGARAKGIYSHLMYGDSKITNYGTIDVQSDGDGKGVEATELHDNATITNEGSISVNAYNAAGIIATQLYDNASITSNGSITVQATGTGYGISVGGEWEGGLHDDNEEYDYEEYDYATITSNSSITAEAIGTGYGISTEGRQEGALHNDAEVVNNGYIEVIANDAYGIYAEEMHGNSKIINAAGATISVASFHNDEGYGSGRGIDANDMHDNAQIINAGTISVVAEYGDAYGISASDLYNNAQIINEGVITAVAEYSDAYGIYAADMYDDSKIVNTGTITVSANDNAIGIEAGNSIKDNAKIINEGDITVTANDDANGIDVRFMFAYAEIVNKGSIEVTGIKASGINAKALYYNAKISNAGTITVKSNVDGTATGIRTNTLSDNAQITNSGFVTVDAVTTAYGISADSLTGSFIDINPVDANAFVAEETNSAPKINNQGTLAITAGYKADGIRTKVVSGEAEMTNSGSISVSAGNRAFGIYSDELSNGSKITNLGTGVITVNSSGFAVGIISNNLGSVSLAPTLDVGALIQPNTIDTPNMETLKPSAISNEGTIKVTATDRGVGIGNNSLFDGSTITNQGDIGVTAGYSAGIAVGFQMSGSIVNTGTITSSGQSEAGGIFTGYFDGSIENAGTITSNGQDIASGIAVMTNGEGSIINSGTITATRAGLADKAAFAIVETNSASSANFITATQSNGLSVSNTGQLNGNLSVAGTLDNAGTIRLPFNANGEESAYVSSFVNSGTLQIGLLANEANSTHSQLVTESATFNEGSKIDVNVLAASTNKGLLIGNKLNDVVASNSLTLNATPDVTDNSVLLDFVFVQDGNNIDLNVIRGKSIPVSTDLGGGNDNDDTAANALQDILDTPNYPEAMQPVFAQLNTLQTDEQVAAAVNSFTPVITSATAGSAAQIANSIQGIVELRQNVNIGGAAGGLSSGDPLFAERNFWVKPFGSRGEQDSKAALNGFNLKTRGIGLGFDGEYAKNQKLGFAFFYTGADVNVKNMVQKADMDVYSFMIYGNTPVLDDKTNFLYQAGYASQNTNTSRYIDLTDVKALGDYTSRVASLDLKVVRDYQIADNLLLQPMASLTYRHLKNPSYSETGAGALNQIVDSFTSSQTTLGLGVRMHYKLDNVSKLIANFNIGRDLRSNALSVSTAFEGAPGAKYQSNGITNGRSKYEFGLGYERNVSEQSKLNLMFTHQGQGGSFKNDAISATYNLKF
jgi:uncharacterized protein with beta-barrel porin domain